MIRKVIGYDDTHIGVFSGDYSRDTAQEDAAEEAKRAVADGAIWAVILDDTDHIVGHVGPAPCDRLWELREGHAFVVRGWTYRARSGSSEGRSYYPGDSVRGPRHEEFRVPVWRPSGTAGHITVNARTKIRFLSEED